MNGNDRARARRNRSLNALGIQIETSSLNIHEDREGPSYRTAFATATKVNDGTMTSSPGPNPQRPDAQMQSSRPGAYRNSKTG